jgi:hypothetical protein
VEEYQGHIEKEHMDYSWCETCVQAYRNLVQHRRSQKHIRELVRKRKKARKKPSVQERPPEATDQENTCEETSAWIPDALEEAWDRVTFGEDELPAECEVLDKGTGSGGEEVEQEDNMAGTEKDDNVDLDNDTTAPPWATFRDGSTAWRKIDPSTEKLIRLARKHRMTKTALGDLVKLLHKPSFHPEKVPQPLAHILVFTDAFAGTRNSAPS